MLFTLKNMVRVPKVPFNLNTDAYSYGLNFVFGVIAMVE